MRASGLVSRQLLVVSRSCCVRARAKGGRINETGGLQCSYHGWSFDGSGACTRIPQAAPEGPEARAVRSPRACATKFPTLLSHRLLFV